MLASVVFYDKKWSRQDIQRVVDGTDSVMDLIDGGWVDETSMMHRTKAFIAGALGAGAVGAVIVKVAKIVQNAGKFAGAATTAIIAIALGGVDGAQYFLQCKLDDLDSSYDGYRVVVSGNVSEDNTEEVQREVEFIPY